MNTIIQERLSSLRDKMKENGLQAYLINGSDPHMSEYVPARWQSREYISGFSGSFGWLAITLKSAALWTDSRYFLQAEEQLKGTGIEMLKFRMPETPSTQQWISNQLTKGETVGFDGSCYSMGEVKSFQSFFSSKEIELNPNADLLEDIWSIRPALPSEKAFLHPVKWAGQTRAEKFDIILSELEQKNANTIIISALDDLGWTFNLRGADVECNPVALGYGLISRDKKQLFIDKSKLAKTDKEELFEQEIEILDYNNFYSEIAQLKDQSILLDPTRSNSLIYETIKSNNHIIESMSIPALLKSIKNSDELEGMKKAHVTDGLALLSFQLWLEEALEQGTVTEYDVAEKLTEYRSKRGGYIGTSFFPIVGYENHGAIVHFRVTPESANTLKKEGILLFDSGGQYEFGTTDITRTIALGPVSDKMKKDFTLVLKGMIGLSKIKFPKGTSGCHLDVLARAALWNENLNYGHGTGHGVGAFMNVHEGPGSIRPDLNPITLKPGNIFSNEPGMYRRDEYGIRIENLVYIIEDNSNEFGDFCKFETLTKFPIDSQLIDKSILTEQEIEWLNNYHSEVLKVLGHFTNTDEYALLKRLTQPI